MISRLLMNFMKLLGLKLHEFNAIYGLLGTS